MTSSRPDAVQNLGTEDMKDPFLAARWIARTSFQHKELLARPVPERDSYSAPGRGRGRGTSRGTGARPNCKALKSSPGFETESQGELNPQTILGCGSGLESRSRDPAPQRGRTRGPSGRSGPSTQKTALQAKQADQSSDKSASTLQVAMKFKKGHKHKQSRSRSNSRDRRKRQSGPSGSEDTVPSSEESVIAAQPKLSSSATQGITPKSNGAGSTYTKRTVGTDAEPLGG